ncbi:hypothetical protein, partial [Kitasatospora indigofera]|uniref:hypothetical protein n=1 Tax=Kitasatospora indigofera TaxID=67307 RepID=UPI001E36AF2A
DDPIEAAMLRQTGVSASAGGTDGLGSVIRRTVLDHMIAAAEAAEGAVISSSDLLAHLARTDADRFGRVGKETDSAWLSRAGKALRGELAILGTELEPTRITLADGSRPNGYTLADLRAAAANLTSAA